MIRFAIYTLQFECKDTKSFSYTQARGGVYAFFWHKASIFTQKEGVSKNDSGFFYKSKITQNYPKILYNSQPYSEADRSSNTRSELKTIINNY